MAVLGQTTRPQHAEYQGVSAMLDADAHYISSPDDWTAGAWVDTIPRATCQDCNEDI